MKSRQQALFAPGVPPPSDDGFFWCQHCNHVVRVSESEEEIAANAPAGSRALLKCPRCHKREVFWRTPTVNRARPTPPPLALERGRELFAKIYELIGVCPQPTNAGELRRVLARAA
jgi:hypothetical protein